MASFLAILRKCCQDVAYEISGIVGENHVIFPHSKYSQHIPQDRLCLIVIVSGVSPSGHINQQQLVLAFLDILGSLYVQ